MALLNSGPLLASGAHELLSVWRSFACGLANEISATQVVSCVSVNLTLSQGKDCKSQERGMFMTEF